MDYLRIGLDWLLSALLSPIGVAVAAVVGAILICLICFTGLLVTQGLPQPPDESSRR